MCPGSSQKDGKIHPKALLECFFLFWTASAKAGAKKSLAQRASGQPRTSKSCFPSRRPSIFQLFAWSPKTFKTTSPKPRFGSLNSQIWTTIAKKTVSEPCCKNTSKTMPSKIQKNGKTGENYRIAKKKSGNV